MHSRLGQALRDDGGLLPLDAVHELDHGVQEAREQATQHVGGAGRLGEEEVGHDGLPGAAAAGGLALEELEEVWVVTALAEVLVRVGVPVGLQVGEGGRVRVHGLDLVGLVLVVGGLQDGGRAAGAVEGEELVEDLPGVSQSVSPSSPCLSRWCFF